MIKRDFRALRGFDRKEVLAILGVAFLFAFALTFRMWGEAEFDPIVGAFNLLFVFTGMLIAVFAHEAGHKIVGAMSGYVVLIKGYLGGLVVSLFTILYSQGLIPLVTPNLVEMDARPDLRLHKYRKYENAAEMALIGAAGLLGSVVSIILFKAAYLLTGIVLFETIILGVCLHMLFSLMPFELLNLVKLRYFEKADEHSAGDGVHLFFYKVNVYLYALLFVLFFSAINLFTDAIGLVLSVLIAAATLLVMRTYLSGKT